MTGVVLHSVAAKAILRCETEHAAVAPHDLDDHPRNAPFAAAASRPAEQYAAQPLSFEVRAYQQRRLGSGLAHAVRTRNPKDRSIAAVGALEDRGDDQPVCRIDAQQLVKKSRRYATERAEESQLQIGRGPLGEQGFNPRPIISPQLAQV